MINTEQHSCKSSVLLHQTHHPSNSYSKLFSSCSNSRTSLRSSSSISLMRKSTFGHAIRKSPFESTVQSPAPKYNIKSGIEINLSESRGPSFSCGRKGIQKSNFSYIQSNMNPGPGAYEAKKVLDKKKIVIGLKNRQSCQQPFLNEKVINKNPGVGKYNLKERCKPSGKLTTQSERFKSDKQNYPGPGAYNKAQSISIINSVPMGNSKCSFNKSLRNSYFDKKTVSPGPGKYKLQ